jgi:hypothetical protein
LICREIQRIFCGCPKAHEDLLKKSGSCSFVLPES